MPDYLNKLNKTFNKIQLQFMTKTLKLEVEDCFLSLIEEVYKIC